MLVCALLAQPSSPVAPAVKEEEPATEVTAAEPTEVEAARKQPAISKTASQTSSIDPTYCAILAAKEVQAEAEVPSAPEAVVAEPVAAVEDKPKKEKVKGPGFFDKVKSVLSPKKSPKASPTEEIAASPLETAAPAAAATEAAAEPAAEAEPVAVAPVEVSGAFESNWSVELVLIMSAFLDRVSPPLRLPLLRSLPRLRRPSLSPLPSRSPLLRPSPPPERSSPRRLSRRSRSTRRPRRRTSSPRSARTRSRWRAG